MSQTHTWISKSKFYDSKHNWGKYAKFANQKIPKAQVPMVPMKVRRRTSGGSAKKHEEYLRMGEPHREGEKRLEGMETL